METGRKYKAEAGYREKDHMPSGQQAGRIPGEGLSEEQIVGLIRTALQMRDRSYAPYSHFCVGAALLDENGTVYTGCNIENAAYAPSNCAERTAFFKAVSEGARVFRAIAIAGASEGDLVEQYCAPCGVCRQVMAEFCGLDFMVIMARRPDDYRMMRLEELLPEAFGPGNL